jgi:hypothetical protein
MSLFGGTVAGDQRPAQRVPERPGGHVGYRHVRCLAVLPPAGPPLKQRWRQTVLGDAEGDATRLVGTETQAAPLLRLR